MRPYYAIMGSILSVSSRNPFSDRVRRTLPIASCVLRRDSGYAHPVCCINIMSATDPSSLRTPPFDVCLEQGSLRSETRTNPYAGEGYPASLPATPISSNRSARWKVRTAPAARRPFSRAAHVEYAGGGGERTDDPHRPRDWRAGSAACTSECSIQDATGPVAIAASPGELIIRQQQKQSGGTDYARQHITPYASAGSSPGGLSCGRH